MNANFAIRAFLEMNAGSSYSGNQASLTPTEIASLRSVACWLYACNPAVIDSGQYIPFPEILPPDLITQIRTASAASVTATSAVDTPVSSGIGEIPDAITEALFVSATILDDGGSPIVPPDPII